MSVTETPVMGLHLTRATHITIDNCLFNSVQRAQGHFRVLSLQQSQKQCLHYREAHTFPLWGKISSLGSFMGTWHAGNALSYIYSELRTHAGYVNKSNEFWFDLLRCRTRDYLWLVIRLRSGWGLLSGFSSAGWLTVWTKTGSPPSLVWPPLQSSAQTESLTMHHSPWQPQGAHWLCPHCLVGGAGSEPCFCKQWDSVNTWNNNSAYLREISG